MKFVRSSLLVKLVILIVVVYAVVTLVSLRNQIADKNAEAAALTSSITAVEQKNGKSPTERSYSTTWVIKRELCGERRKRLAGVIAMGRGRQGRGSQST